jgi:transposase
MAVMGGTGPHQGSHTAVAAGAARGAAGQAAGAGLPGPGRDAGCLGAGLAGADLGGARRPRAGPAAGPAAGRRRRAGAGCAARAGCPGPAAGAGDTNKTDPDDARPVAVAALRSKGRQEVTADGHAVVLTVRAKRHRDLSRTRNQVVCRLHAVLCELIPGGVPDEITAGQAARILGQAAPAGAVARARCELAAELPAGIGHLDARRREASKKLAAAVTASGTSLTEVSGAGPVIAATVTGDVITVARFPGRDHFAACNGTAPAGVSAGQRKIHRLSLRGSRRLNHAVPRAAINWIRHEHSDGRACCQRKLAEGKTRTEALRCLRRRISDAIGARLRADARKAGPGGQPGNDTDSGVTGSPPGHRPFGQATSGPGPSLRAPATVPQATPAPGPPAKKIQRAT